MSLLLLAGGTVVDPRNLVSPTVRDLWLRGGRVVAGPEPGETPARTFDLAGLVVMPGGVDMHAHLAGPKVNAARKLRPEERVPVARHGPFRGGSNASTPSSFLTGHLYAGMGYTTVFDAAIAPLGARAAHEEFHDVPIVDKGLFVLAGNNHYALEQVAANEPEKLRHYLGWLLRATRAYALKIVNPGGVEAWKQGGPGLLEIDDAVPGFGTTPRAIVAALARAADDLKLPHPVHVHCNRLGLPGNWHTTLATMQALDGSRGHFTHIQFHSYGGDASDPATMSSRVPALADYVNAHPAISVDVGQVLFGETTAMTGDSALGHFLHRATGRKWLSADLECEGGCGIVPIEYRDRSFVNALQWAAGLEWYLLVNDPWRVAMSTDHPNGAAFVAYPEIIALLMSREYRREVLSRLPPLVRERCTLWDLDREYTLQEIAIITRAGPARLLGLENKGHLGDGADADITVYSPDADRRAMFSLPKFVFKAGELIVEDGELRRPTAGGTLAAAVEYDDGILAELGPWYAENYSLDVRSVPIGAGTT